MTTRRDVLAAAIALPLCVPQPSKTQPAAAADDVPRGCMRWIVTREEIADTRNLSALSCTSPGLLDTVAQFHVGCTREELLREIRARYALPALAISRDYERNVCVVLVGEHDSVMDWGRRYAF